MKKLMTIWVKVDADDDDGVRIAETNIREAIERAGDYLLDRDVAIDIDAVDIKDDEEESKP